jgi:hypothetical protein
MQVDTQRSVPAQRKGRPGGEADVRDAGKLDGDLDGRVSGPDDHDTLPGELVGSPVAGHVHQPAGVMLLPGQHRPVRPAETATRRDDRPGAEAPSIGELDGVEGGRVGSDAPDAGVGPDREVEVVRVGPQVGHRLVARRVSAAVPGHGEAGQLAEAGR